MHSQWGKCTWSSNREGSVSKWWTMCCWHHKSGWRRRPQSTARRYFSSRMNDILYTQCGIMTWRQLYTRTQNCRLYVHRANVNHSARAYLCKSDVKR